MQALLNFTSAIFDFQCPIPQYEAEYPEFGCFLRSQNSVFHKIKVLEMSHIVLLF